MDGYDSSSLFDEEEYRKGIPTKPDEWWDEYDEDEEMFEDGE